MSDFKLDPAQHVPKLVKDRLIRIETRLVKYQEGNVLAINELTESVEDLCRAMQEVIHIISEGAENAEES